MKIINLTKDSFVEKVADYQSYPEIGRAHV